MKQLQTKIHNKIKQVNTTDTCTRNANMLFGPSLE